MEKVWFQNYPEGSPTTLDTSKYDSILDILDKAIRSIQIVPHISIWGRF